MNFVNLDVYRADVEGNKTNCFLRDRSLSDCYIAFFVVEKKNSLKNAPNTRGKHKSHHSLINSALLPSDVTNFCPRSQILPAHGRLEGNCLFVRCHVTMNQAMNARVVLKELQLYNKVVIQY